MKKLIILVFTLLQAACVTLHNPIPEDYVGERASISDSYSNKESTTAHFFMVDEIDGKKIEDSWGATRLANDGRGFYFKPKIVSREVMAKEQTFTIQGMVFFPTDAQALFLDDMAVTEQVRFSPAPGEKYTVRGKLSAQGSEVWLEDASGNKVPRN